jgi:hypothetical protein
MKFRAIPRLYQSKIPNLIQSMMRGTFIKVLPELNSPWGTRRGHWRKQSGEEDLVVTPPFQIFVKMLNT